MFWYQVGFKLFMKNAKVPKEALGRRKDLDKSLLDNCSINTQILSKSLLLNSFYKLNDLLIDNSSELKL